MDNVDNVYIVTRRSGSQSSKDFDLRYKLQGPSRGGGFIFKRNARNTSTVGRRHSAGRTQFPVDLFISYLTGEKRRLSRFSSSIASDDTRGVRESENLGYPILGSVRFGSDRVGSGSRKYHVTREYQDSRDLENSNRVSRRSLSNTHSVVCKHFQFTIVFNNTDPEIRTKLVFLLNRQIISMYFHFWYYEKIKYLYKNANKYIYWLKLKLNHWIVM